MSSAANRNGAVRASAGPGAPVSARWPLQVCRLGLAHLSGCASLPQQRAGFVSATRGAASIEARSWSQNIGHSPRQGRVSAGQSVIVTGNDRFPVDSRMGAVRASGL